MQDMPANIGLTIKSARQAMGLSLTSAAALTGVSKAMLGQIERGESTPTISTLWKISAGLRITFSKLLSNPENEYEMQSLRDITPLLEDGGRMALYNIFPFDPVTGFDYFIITMQPGCHYTSPSHPNVFEEYVVVTEGRMRLTVDKQAFDLPAGSALRFRGDAAHVYANPYNEVAVFQNVMKYL